MELKGRLHQVHLGGSSLASNHGRGRWSPYSNTALSDDNQHNRVGGTYLSREDRACVCACAFKGRGVSIHARVKQYCGDYNKWKGHGLGTYSHIKMYSLWHKSLVSSSPFGQSRNPSHILVLGIGGTAPDWQRNSGGLRQDSCGFSTMTEAFDPSSVSKKRGQSTMPSQRLLVFKHLRTWIPFSWCAGQARLPHPSHWGPTQGNSSSGSLIGQFLSCALIVRTAQSAAKKTNSCSGSTAALKLDIFFCCSRSASLVLSDISVNYMEVVLSHQVLYLQVWEGLASVRSWIRMRAYYTVHVACDDRSHHVREKVRALCK